MKPPLLLLHGALGASPQFNSWISILETDFKVFTMDFDGHGISGFDGKGFQMDSFVTNILDFLDQNELKQTNVFGYSMGGYAALLAASKYPSRFLKVMTLGTKFDWSPEVSAREVKMLNADKIAEKVPKFAAILESRHSGIGWRKVLEFTASMVLDLGNSPGLLPEVLNSINLPVRIGLGERDIMVNITETVDAYKALPNAQFQVFPNTGHPLEESDSRLVSEGMREFFL